MIRTQVMFTPILKTQVSNYANQQGLSFSAAVRSLLAKSLLSENQQKKNVVQSLLNLADSAGQGPSDLASNDEYYYKDSKK